MHVRSRHACASTPKTLARWRLACARQAVDDDLPVDPAYCPYWKLSFEMATKADWLTLMVVFSLVCLFIASERRQQRCMREVRAVAATPHAVRDPSACRLLLTSPRPVAWDPRSAAITFQYSTR